jgi:hypothetical protein
MAKQAKRAPARDVLFFETLQQGATVGVACNASGYQHSAVYRWRKQDPAFATLWTEAQDIAADLLEEEADRRARDGYDETTSRSDGLQIIRNKRSDGLLLARLKAMRPERYRERSGSDGPKPIVLVARNHLKELAERLAREGIARKDMDLTSTET